MRGEPREYLWALLIALAGTCVPVGLLMLGAASTVDRDLHRSSWFWAGLTLSHTSWHGAGPTPLPRSGEPWLVAVQPEPRTSGAGGTATDSAALPSKHSSSANRPREGTSASARRLSTSGCVVTRTREAVLRIPSLEYLPDEEARRIGNEIVLDVRRTGPESTPEMVDYAMGMLFRVPTMR